MIDDSSISKSQFLGRQPGKPVTRWLPRIICTLPA
jgi:hypothetical protein